MRHFSTYLYPRNKCKKISILTDFPFTHSVARELDAIADPQPNVLNFASTIFPSSSTLIYINKLILEA